MTPRPFQSVAIAAVGDAFRAGKQSVCLVAPTGAGKTVMGAFMVSALVAQGKRIAWGAHRQELVDQAADTMRAMGVEVGVNGYREWAPVQIGTYQAWIAAGRAPDADYFFPDECHHLADKTGWTDIQRAYRNDGKRCVGLTATPARGDGQALPLFDHIVVAAQVRELQALGLLVKLRIKRSPRKYAKDRIAQTPCEAYREWAVGQSAIVFAPHIKAAEAFRDEFRLAGVACDLVTGAMPDDRRKDALARFSTGQTAVLVNVAVLTEGFDAPWCSCVILGRGCGSQALYIQMTGRALRPYPGKTEALLVDLRGASYDLGRPDEDREFSLEGEGIKLARQANVPRDRECKVCHEPLGELVTCPRCETVNEVIIPKATGADLVDWDESYETAKAIMPVSNMIKSLAGMLRKSKSSDAAFAKFRAIFKHHPSAQTVASAINFNRAIEKTHEAALREAMGQ